MAVEGGIGQGRRKGGKGWIAGMGICVWLIRPLLAYFRALEGGAAMTARLKEEAQRSPVGMFHAGIHGRLGAWPKDIETFAMRLADAEDLLELRKRIRQSSMFFDP